MLARAKASRRGVERSVFIGESAEREHRRMSAEDVDRMMHPPSLPCAALNALAAAMEVDDD